MSNSVLSCAPTFFSGGLTDACAADHMLRRSGWYTTGRAMLMDVQEAQLELGVHDKLINSVGMYSILPNIAD